MKYPADKCEYCEGKGIFREAGNLIKACWKCKGAGVNMKVPATKDGGMKRYVHDGNASSLTNPTVEPVRRGRKPKLEVEMKEA